MPTLFRFVTMIVIAAGLVFAAMFALATFVTPRQTQMVVPLALEEIDPSTVSTPSQ